MFFYTLSRAADFCVYSEDFRKGDDVVSAFYPHLVSRKKCEKLTFYIYITFLIICSLSSHTARLNSPLNCFQCEDVITLI